MYREIKQDLFEVDNSYTLVHCIAADAAMGAGIAVQFARRFPNMALTLRAYTLDVGTAVFFPNEDYKVINLVTKPKSWQKPSYASFVESIESMKHIVQRYSIEKIAMPRIGSGLDRLDWNICRSIIQDEFKDVDVEILVCYL
jgi:O-acetyl-ADP-ribose deacetylase (regulator of RNase III)